MTCFAFHYDVTSGHSVQRRTRGENAVCRLRYLEGKDTASLDCARDGESSTANLVRAASTHIIFRSTAVARDEITGVNPAARVLPITGTDKGRRKFAHLEMQIRPILPVRSSDGRNLLAASHVLPRRDKDFFDVAVNDCTNFRVPPSS